MYIASKTSTSTAMVKVSVIPGNTKPCDFHIEHMNRLLKVCFHNLGANKTKNVISQYSKCMGPLGTTLMKSTTVQM